MVSFSRPALTLALLIPAVLSAGVTTPQAAAPQPHKIQLQSRIAPRGSSLKSRSLSPVTVPLADFFKGTDLQWYGNISVGTPPQDITVVFDTGSYTLEFASTLCAACTHQVQFDPKKSTTYVDGGRQSTITFSTGVGVDPVKGNNYQLKLRSATDTVTVGGLVAKKTDLYLITDQTPTFDINPFSGIQGMGTDAEGFFGALIDQGLPSIFGMYLTPNSIGSAELTVGGIDTTKFTSPLTYIPLSDSSGSWDLSSSKISVNGLTTSVLSTRRTIIFDSGTSNILFPTKTANAIYALISTDIKPFADEPGTYGLPCAKVKGLEARIDLTFMDESGRPFNLTIPSGELSVGPFESDGSVCQMLINAFDGLSLVGGSLMKHWYTVHDVGKQRMGFAPNGV